MTRKGTAYISESSSQKSRWGLSRLAGLLALGQVAEETKANDYLFSDLQLNSIGLFLLEEGILDGAIEILTLNVELYPEVGNVYDSLGEAYLAKGDEDLAIANYRKALELDPDNDYAKEVLQRLGAAVSASM